MLASPKGKLKRAVGPSALERKDASKRLSDAHAMESLVATMRDALRAEGDSAVDALAHEDYEVPASPIESSPEEAEGRSKVYGASALAANAKSIAGSTRAKLRDERQQRVDSERPVSEWTLTKDVDDLKRLIGLAKKAKAEERGAPRSSLLEARESIAPFANATTKAALCLSLERRG